MNWRLKALIQQCVAQLPAGVSDSVYFALQRKFGNLRAGTIDPTSRLQIGFELCRQIIEHGGDPRGATFFEVGTGWRLNVPIACWLCGADRIITVDLNRFLNETLIRDDFDFMRRQKDAFASRIHAEFGDLVLPERWERLIGFAASEPSTAEVCSFLNIEYHAPADAGRTHLEDRSVDYHISCNVLEHIPSDSLRSIFCEAQRIVRPTGLILHRVDHTDHFSHADAGISPIHFLRFSDAEWKKYAGNRFAYVNRLREDDYIALWEQCGIQMADVLSRPDEPTLQMLQSGSPLDDRFRDKSTDALARLTSLFVAAPGSASGSEISAAVA